MNGASTLRGSVQRIVWASEDGGFAVLRVSHEGGTTSVVGQGLGLHEGEDALFTGSWVDDPRYGRQFRAVGYTPLTPDTLHGIRRFLSAGLIKGIGEPTAEKLLEAFGDRIFQILEEGEPQIARLKGIGRKRAKLICDSYREHRSYRDLMVFLQTYGIGPGLALRIHRRYGVFALDRVRENPYRLAMEVHGVGFKTADRFALALGLPHDSIERAQAGSLYKLEEAFDEGHLYLPYEELCRKAEEELSVPQEAIARALLSLETLQATVRDGEAIYLSGLHELECRVAKALHELASRRDPERGASLMSHLEAVRKRLGFDLSPEQLDAVRDALTQRITVITGGPGTGKTTLVKAITAVARRLSLRLELASPTGRAAKRLSEATGEPARTIHRLLEFSPETGRFERNEEKPLSCDLLIVDEGSMIDMRLMGDLLAAIPAHASLVLVGDADQLPSVGAGTVFRDLVSSGRIPVERLSHIYRQARGSLIVENAHRILHGEAPQVPKASEVDQGQDFFLVWEEDPSRIVERVKNLVKERIPARFEFDPWGDVQVLSPMHRGLAGVSNLNRELQALLNPEGDELKSGEQLLRAGDKVMQLRNDYDKEVFNGDIGRIVAVNASERIVVVDFGNGVHPYQGEDLSDIQLAYASSVHKAQGSEYPAVIVVLAREHYIMCQRNLLYTAVTRGKALTVVVGSRSALHRAVRNDQVQRRYSKLLERLQA